MNIANDDGSRRPQKRNKASGHRKSKSAAGRPLVKLFGKRTAIRRNSGESEQAELNVTEIMFSS